MLIHLFVLEQNWSACLQVHTVNTLFSSCGQLMKDSTVSFCQNTVMSSWSNISQLSPLFDQRYKYEGFLVWS